MLMTNHWDYIILELIKFEEQSVLNLTSSGGVTINDCMGHIQQNDLGFGGVGPSGMGKYDGKDGFLNFFKL